MDVVLKFTPAKFHMKFYVLSILWREIKYPKIRQYRLQKGLWSYMKNCTGFICVHSYSAMRKPAEAVQETSSDRNFCQVQSV